MLTILVAMDENRVIGKDGKIPWHNSEDLKLFKKRTIGHAVIMGRKTWEGLSKKPLPDRMNIVVSKSIISDKKLYISPTLEYAVALAEYNFPDNEIFIIGGGQIYGEAISKNMVDRILISKIPGEYDGNIFFPELNENWRGTEKEVHETFVVWEYVKIEN